MMQLIRADARRIPLADESVQCVVTSPPYWGLRKYAGEQELIWTPEGGCEHDFESHTGKPLGNTCRRCGAWKGAFGLEPTVEMYVEHSVLILREIRRVLRRDGVCFWNIGDSYHRGSRGAYMRPRCVSEKSMRYQSHGDVLHAPNRFPQEGLKPKDLVMMPARVALAAQADGWWVRSDIIWAKPNTMPESVKDRPTNAYEHILMLTRGERYFWDADAVKERVAESTIERLSQKTFLEQTGGEKAVENLHAKAFGYTPKGTHSRGTGDGGPKARQRAEEGWAVYRRTKTREVLLERNMRNVWMFATQPYKGAHFATFPEELPQRCIKAASRPGDLILDPFGGSGTTGRVAVELGRRAVLLDLAYQAGAYKELAERRTSQVQIDLLAAANA